MDIFHDQISGCGTFEGGWKALKLERRSSPPPGLQVQGTDSHFHRRSPTAAPITVSQMGLLGHMAMIHHDPAMPDGKTTFDFNNGRPFTDYDFYPAEIGKCPQFLEFPNLPVDVPCSIQSCSTFQLCFLPRDGKKWSWHWHALGCLRKIWSQPNSNGIAPELEIQLTQKSIHLRHLWLESFGSHFLRLSVYSTL